MARRARFDRKNYYYHVICRGQRKIPLFFSPEDNEVYLRILNKLLRETDIELFVLCLMINHIHLLVKRNNTSLHYFMKRLNTKYATYFNNKRNLTGHVFQGRYKSKTVLDNTYLNHLVKYIHFNPVKANIVENPEDYKYSSAKFYKDGTIKIVENLNLLPSFEGAEKIHTLDTSAIPRYKDIIGTKEDYINFEKREEGREKGKTRERRKESVIMKDFQYLMGNEEVSADTLLKSKGTRKYTTLRLKVIRKLMNLGYSKIDIARLFGYEKSSINKILERS